MKSKGKKRPRRGGPTQRWGNNERKAEELEGSLETPHTAGQEGMSETINWNRRGEGNDGYTEPGALEIREKKEVVGKNVRREPTGLYPYTVGKR